MKQVKGLTLSFNGEKQKCELCNRSHSRSFVVFDDETNKIEFYGSGCVQKIGLNSGHLSRVLVKALVQIANLSYELSNFQFKKEIKTKSKKIREDVDNGENEDI